MFGNIAKYREELAGYASTLKALEKMKASSVMVTGSAGLIGTYIVDIIMVSNEINGTGIKVYAVDSNEERNAARFSEYKDNELLTLYKHDITTPLPESFPKVDYIIHAASNTSPVDYGKYPVATGSANTLGTYFLLDYARKTGAKKFLFCSSVEAYGQNRGDIDKFTEDYSGYIDCNTPRAAYPCGKRAAESMCASFKSEYGVDYVTARIGRFYGPTVITGDTKAPTQFITNGLNKEDIVLKSDGTQLYSWGYVGDAAAGLIHMLVFGESGEVYNIADSNSVAMLRDFAQAVADNAGTKLVFIEQNAAEKAGYSKVTKAVLDVTKLEATGWKALYDYKEGISRTIEYLNEVK